MPEMSASSLHIGIWYSIFFRETIVNTVDNKLKSGDVDDYYLLIAAAIYFHEQVSLFLVMLQEMLFAIRSGCFLTFDDWTFFRRYSVHLKL